jgi:ribosomal protein S27E
VDLKVGDMVLVISDSDGFVAFAVSDGGDKFMRAGPAPGDQQRTGFGESSTRITHDIAGTLILGGTGGVAHVFIIPRANLR